MMHVEHNIEVFRTKFAGYFSGPTHKHRHALEKEGSLHPRGPLPPLLL